MARAVVAACASQYDGGGPSLARDATIWEMLHVVYGQQHVQQQFMSNKSDDLLLNVNNMFTT